jgi:hypothetical protein
MPHRSPGRRWRNTRVLHWWTRSWRSSPHHWWWSTTHRPSPHHIIPSSHHIIPSSHHVPSPSYWWTAHLPARWTPSLKISIRSSSATRNIRSIPPSTWHAWTWAPWTWAPSTAKSHVHGWSWSAPSRRSASLSIRRPSAARKPRIIWS